MRRTIAALLSLVLVFGLTACGADGETASSATSAPTVSTSATGTSTEADRVTTTRRPVSQPSGATTTTTTTTGTMSKQEYLNQKKIDVVGSSADPKTWIYQLGTDGVMVREATFDSGRGGAPVEIVQISDMHFNSVNGKDLEEQNPSIMAIKDHRKPMGAARINAEKCLQYASYFDQTVITGDTIDFLTWGALDMVKSIIWDKYPNTLITLGNHDSVRTWTFKGYVADTTTRESRYEILQDNWKHDIFYTSKVLGNKVLIVQMENGALTFNKDQIAKLKADIATAKSKGYIILLFFHVPIGTGKSEDAAVKPIRVTSQQTNKLNATDVNLRDADTLEMYNLITNNADVIKGIFTGHVHNDHYVEVKAKTSDGQDAVIPQYVLAGSFYDNGHVLKITVK